jgi:hypothetical protein
VRFEPATSLCRGVRQGEIVESRDYANHLAFASALDRLPQPLASVEKDDAKRMP